MSARTVKAYRASHWTDEDARELRALLDKRDALAPFDGGRPAEPAFEKLVDELADAAHKVRDAEHEGYPDLLKHCEGELRLAKRRVLRAFAKLQKFRDDVAALVSCSSPDGSAELAQVRMLADYHAARAARIARKPARKRPAKKACVGACAQSCAIGQLCTTGSRCKRGGRR